MASFIEISPVADVAMDNSWFRVNDTDHFWMQWRFRVMRRNFPFLFSAGKSHLEIGCGNGRFRDQCEDAGMEMDACDLNREGLVAAREGRGKLFLYDIMDLKPELTGRYDGIFLMDVIEHVDDDAAFLKAAAAHATPDGYLVVNVPAHAFLWSAYDEAQGHCRRYTRKLLRQRLEEAGLQCEAVFYWGASLVPLLWMRKMFLGSGDHASTKKGFEPPSAWIHQCLKAWMRLETLLLKRTFTGTSVMALARKPSKA